jgi:hypothetical protein
LSICGWLGAQAQDIVASDVSLCVSLAGCFQVSVGACGSCLDFSVQTAYMGWAGINPAFMGQLSPHPNKMFIALREIAFFGEKWLFIMVPHKTLHTKFSDDMMF